MRQMKTIIVSFLLISLLSACKASPVYEDDFSDTNSGWDTHHSLTAGAVYTEGSYRLTLNEANRDQWAIAHRDFENVAIEVDVRKVEGSDDNSFGLVCKYQDMNHFYMLLISSDGAYMIQKKSEERITRLSGEWFQTTEDVNLGNAENKLRAECGDGYLALYANGKLLDRVEDDSYSHGDIGFVVGTYTQPYVSIAFDNLKVYALP